MADSFPKRSTIWSMLFLIGTSAALAGTAAVLLSLLFVSSMPALNGIASSAYDVVVFSLAAALASLLIGLLFWWLFIIGPGQFSRVRGVLVGSLSSLVAHPLTWFLAVVVAPHRGMNSFLNLVLTQTLMEELQAIPTLSIYSLVLVGWLTALIGGVVGGILVGVVARIGRNG